MIVLVGITEGLLQTGPLLSCVGRNLRIRDLHIMQLQQVGIQPLAVGLLLCKAFLDLLVAEDLAPDGIHQQHLARVETFLL